MGGEFVLGTDNLGRDMLTRLIYGARTTLLIACSATAISFTAGCLLGVVAAVSGGWIDQLISRWVDMLFSIPTLIFALVVLAVLPPGKLTLVLVMGVLDSTRVFRLARAIAIDVNVMDFVKVAKLRGENLAWIVFREILPNGTAVLVAELGLRFVFAVLFLSSLSFLGLGVQPPEVDLGSIVRENKDGIIFGIEAALVPAALIALLSISVNTLADEVLSRTADLRGGKTRA